MSVSGRGSQVRAWTLLFLGMLAFSAPQDAFASYDSNLSGIADGVYTYPSGEVLIHLTNQPASHPSCNASYFAIDPGVSSIDPNAMSRMFARLMTSYATQQAINIGYDGHGDCVDGYIHVWRIG